jgi:hypothetical protein
VRPEGLIKVSRSASALIGNGAEKLGYKQISIINLNGRESAVNRAVGGSTYPG